MTALPNPRALAAADLLDRSAGWLEGAPGRWTQYALWRDAEGRGTSVVGRACSACALGVLWFSQGDDVTDEARRDAFGALCSDVGQWAPLWNDAPSRTVSEVVAQFRATAHRLRAEAGAVVA